MIKIRLSTLLGRFLVVILSFSLILSLMACEPLRKKFTRKKKEDAKENFIPVLDPINYPPAFVTAEEKYKHHYSLWNVWQKELLQALDRDESEKRLEYLMGQLEMNLDSMRKWVEASKQEEINARLSDYVQIKKEMDKPEAMRNVYSLKRKIQLNVKKVRDTLHPKLMTDFYIK
ncbi:MAG TPA: hypothetical protein VJA17_01770 [Candidatus Omnitrophota bacterium]|nr:hypothetical protein [Candidatus Omnitrophota bacterium]